MKFLNRGRSGNMAAILVPTAVGTVLFALVGTPFALYLGALSAAQERAAETVKEDYKGPKSDPTIPIDDWMTAMETLHLSDVEVKSDSSNNLFTTKRKVFISHGNEGSVTAILTFHNVSDSPLTVEISHKLFTVHPGEVCTFSSPENMFVMADTASGLGVYQFAYRIDIVTHGQ